MSEALCKICGVKPTRGTRGFCRSCSLKDFTIDRFKVCQQCGIRFEKNGPSARQWLVRRFCSNRCRVALYRVTPMVLFCSGCGIEIAKRSLTGKCLSCSHKGKKNPHKGYVWTDEQRRKRGLQVKGRIVKPVTREKMRLAMSGAKSHFWRGGVTKKNRLIRASAAYRIWRESVFKRDDFTCQECGQRGGKLNADHIKPFSTHPDLRLDLDNGRTLCVPCHKKTPTYGNRKKLCVE